MPHVTSADGTAIGYDRLGDGGPVLVLAGGGQDHGTENVPLGAPGGSVHRRQLPAPRAWKQRRHPAVRGSARGRRPRRRDRRIAVHEVPYLLGEEMLAAWRAYRAELAAALDAGDRDEALRLFMRLAGWSAEGIAAARGRPGLAGAAAARADAALRHGLPGRRPAPRSATRRRDPTGTAHDRRNQRSAFGGPTGRLLRRGRRYRRETPRRCAASDDRDAGTHPRPGRSGARPDRLLRRLASTASVNPIGVLR